MWASIAIAWSPTIPRTSVTQLLVMGIMITKKDQWRQWPSEIGIQVIPAVLLFLVEP